MKLILVNETKDLALNLKTKRLEAFLKVILRHFSKVKLRNKKDLLQKKELTLVFLDKKEMKKINFQFRKKNKATDVLSFQSEDPDSFGELLFCVDVLKIQAKEQKHSVEQEFLYMLIHGILHLLGYDHELSKNEEKLMFRLQDQCFKQLNDH
jgi:probable rRNA maturation factor